MTSIRRALTVRLLLTLGLLMTAIGLALFLGVRLALIKQFDATLLARAATLEAATRWNGRTVDLDYVDEAMPWYRPGPDAEYFEIRQMPPDGAPGPIIARSPSLSAEELAPAAGNVIGNERLPDGRPGRAATRLIKPPPEEEFDEPDKASERSRVAATAPTLRVTVAMSRARLDAALGTIATALVLGGAVMAVSLVIGVRLALSSGLAPIRKLSADIAQVRADTLSSRLPGADIPEELRSIHARLNELIERLEVAFAREQRFASAAAHELRTPVAELRALLEVAVSRPRTAESAKDTAKEALAITVRMENLVQVLLSPGPAPGPLTGKTRPGAVAGAPPDRGKVRGRCAIPRGADRVHEQRGAAGPGGPRGPGEHPVQHLRQRRRVRPPRAPDPLRGGPRRARTGPD
jgi:signal transduction histidine kinase